MWPREPGVAPSPPQILNNEGSANAHALPPSLRAEIAEAVRVDADALVVQLDAAMEQMVFAEAGSVMPLLASDAYHRGHWKTRQRRRFATIYGA